MGDWNVEAGLRVQGAAGKATKSFEFRHSDGLSTPVPVREVVRDGVGLLSS
ncbi:MAG: hypothetical protein ACKVK3_17075 [Acidimicrobiales bacterium]